MIVAHTFLSNHIYYLNFIAFFIFIYEVVKQNQNINSSFSKPNIFKTKTIQSISCMRGLTYLITVFSILAVDFLDFPRYLAKTEKYGYSFMDTGVGLFALMSGLVHKNIKNDTFMMIMKGNIKFFTILILLGTARFLSVKQLNYQEHVTEYGVHWNFFYTLAICKMLSTLFLYVYNKPFPFSVITMAIHELTLYIGLQTWVFSQIPRNDFISANREGLCSSLGYVSLYFFAAHIKNVISDRTVYRGTVLKKLVIGAISLSLLTYSVNIFRPASRILANTAYCIFLQAVLCTVLALLYFLETIAQNDDVKFHFDIPVIMKDINMNGLSYFLVSNLMTGAVNLSIRTLLVPGYVTFIVLNLYMVLNIIFVVFMKEKGYKI